MRVRPRLASFSALAVLAVSLAACGSSGDGKTLTLYSGRIEPILGTALEQYEAASGGFEIKARYGDSPSLAATIVEEGKNSPADLFFA